MCFLYVFLQFELPFKVTSYLLLLEYVLCLMNLLLRRISTVVIYNVNLNKGQLNTATYLEVNKHRSRYANFPIINHFFTVPTNAHPIHFTRKTLKFHIKLLNVCPYMFRSLLKPFSGGS
jgi:hypothetical protein